MLFKVHSDLATGDEKAFFEMNPGALAIEEFNKCTSRQMFFVCLVADRDWDSPYRTLPERTRRERAVLTAGYPMEGNRPDKNARNLINSKVEKVERAITKYKEIQWDEERAMFDAATAQIQEALSAIAADKTALATVVKKKKNKDTGEESVEEYVDVKALAALRLEAVKLSALLPSLRDAKAKLMAGLNIAPALEGITTWSSQDLSGDEDDPLEGEGSTLDAFNEKQKRQKT
jgi:hypothetical protein